MSSKFKSLIKDSTVYGLGRVLGKVPAFITVPIFTRVFSPDDYGVIDVLAAFMSMASIFIILGFSSASTYYFFATENRDDRKITLSTTFVFRIILSTFICLVIFVFAGSICALIFHDLKYVPYLRIVSATIPFSVLETLFTNILRMKFEKWKYIFVNLGNHILAVILVLILVLSIHMGLKGVFIGRLISGVIFCCIGFYLVRDLVEFSFSWVRFKELLCYSLPLFPGIISVWVLHFSDRYFLVNFTTLESVGLYSVGYKLSSIIFLVTSAFRIAWAPLGFSVSRDDDARTFYADVLLNYIIFMSIFAVLISIFAREALIILVPDSYYGGSQVAGWLALSEVLYGILPIMGMGILLTKNTRVNSYAFGTAAIVNIILNYFLITMFGFIGAALATLISFIVADVIVYCYAQKYYKVPYQFNKIVLVFLFSVLAVTAGNMFDRNWSIFTPFFKTGLLALYIGSLFGVGALKVLYLRKGANIVMRLKAKYI